MINYTPEQLKKCAEIYNDSESAIGGVYDMLKIWVKDESGEDKLYTLKEKNVDAIYLGHTQTDFTLRSGNSGKINGAIRKTGIFLYENGVAGTVSHLDMAN